MVQVWYSEPSKVAHDWCAAFFCWISFSHPLSLSRWQKYQQPLFEDEMLREIYIKLILNISIAATVEAKQQWQLRQRERVMVVYTELSTNITVWDVGGGNFAQIFELKQQATFGISLACRAVLHCEHFNLAAN